MRRNNYFKVNYSKLQKKLSISVCGPNIWEDVPEIKFKKSFLRSETNSE